MFKLDQNSKFSLKNLKNVLNSRINLLKFNKKIKRRARSLDFLKHYNATEFFNWFFYISPIMLRNLIPNQAYGYLMLLTYFINFYWTGGKRNEVDYIHGLVKVFLEDIEEHFDVKEFTINSHLLIHLKRVFLDYGPLKDNNSFIFESSKGAFSLYNM